MQNATQQVNQLVELLNNSSKLGYIGENISQLEHALQAAFFATQAGASRELILASLLHDIGHFCTDEPVAMGGLGVVSHEKKGAQFLSGLGFSQEVTCLVESHVEAKRYLVFKHPKYYAQLSEASKKTLEYQGGPMTAQEAAKFERDPLGRQKLALRKWDETAKKTDFQAPRLANYESLLLAHLESHARISTNLSTSGVIADSV